MKRENKRDKKVLIILFSVLTCIIIALMIGMTINIKQGKIDISGIISKWTEKEPEASTTNGIEENVREIDLTRIITGEDTRHTHIYEKRYDSNYHWEQCWMCNEVINKKAHNLATAGIESCSDGIGYQQQYCTDGCGYNIQLEKPEHIMSDEIISKGSWGFHSHWCKVCGDQLDSPYCTNSNGERIGCSGIKTGVCAICGYDYTNMKHGNMQNGRCSICGEKLADWSYRVESVNESSTRIYHTITPISGVEFTELDTASAGTWSGGGVGEYWDFKIEGFSKVGGTIYITALYTAKDNAPVSNISKLVGTTYVQDGQKWAAVFVTYDGSPDNYAPTKNNITGVGSGSIGNFGTKATVTATFTDGGLPENNVVYMRLLDKDKNTVISDWGAASKNGTTYTRAFDVTAEIREASNVYVQAKDATRKYNRNR